jgi:hypothetical protein
VRFPLFRRYADDEVSIWNLEADTSPANDRKSGVSKSAAFLLQNLAAAATRVSAAR